MIVPRENTHFDKIRWLACPTTERQIETYWQAQGRLRRLGLELDLCPCGAEPPWQALSHASPWRGLVLWGEGLQTIRLLTQARQRWVSVWRM